MSERPEHPVPVEPFKGDLPDYESDGPVPPLYRRLLADWKFRVLLVLVVLVAALVIWGRPGYREIKARRALGLIADGEKELGKGDVAGAFSKFRAAFSIAPSDERVRRVLTRYQAQAGQQESFRLMVEAFQEGKSDADDLLTLADLALRHRDVDLARQVVGAFPQDLTPDQKVRAAIATASVRATEGRMVEAIRLLKAEELPAEGQDKLRLALGRLLLASAATGAEGTGMLAELGTGNSPESLAALRLLLSLTPPADLAVGEGWAARLEGHPLRTQSDVLLAARFRIALRPESREEVVGRVLQAAGDKSLAARIDLARWLNGIGEPVRTLQLLGKADATANQDALLLRLDAFVALLKIREAKEFLETTDCPTLDPALRAAILGRFCLALRDTVAAEGHFEEMMRSARLSPPPALRAAAQQAFGSWREEEGLRLLEMLAKKSDPSASDIYAFALKDPPTIPPAEMAELLDQALAQQPDHEDTNILRTYYGLLAKEDATALLKRAEELHAQAPDRLETCSLLALARLSNNDPRGALSLFEGKSVQWDRASRPSKVAAAAVLSANSLQTEAQIVLDPIRIPDLSPAERTLFGD